MRTVSRRGARAVLCAAALAAALGTGCAAESTPTVPTDASAAVDGAALAADVADAAGPAAADSAGDSQEAMGDGAAPLCLVKAPVAGPVQKISYLELAFDATGCDRTGDGLPDNALGQGLSQAGGAFNARLAENLANGSLVMLFSASEFRSDGKPFALDLLSGKLGPQSLACAPTAVTADCGYQVLPSSYVTTATSAICPPKTAFGNARVALGVLEAGGQGETIQLPLPAQDLSLNLALMDVRLAGKVASAVAPDGKPQWLSTSEGVLCGVLTKSALFAAIDALPDEQVAARGFSKPVLKAMLASLLVADVAVDSAVPNAYSATIRMVTVPGHLVAP